MTTSASSFRPRPQPRRARPPAATGSLRPSRRRCCAATPGATRPSWRSAPCRAASRSRGPARWTEAQRAPPPSGSPAGGAQRRRGSGAPALAPRGCALRRGAWARAGTWLLLELLRESPSRIRVGDRRPNGGANSGSCAVLRGGTTSFTVLAPRGRIGEATECLRRNPTSASGGAALETGCRSWTDPSMLPARTILERARASAPRAVGDRAAPRPSPRTNRTRRVPPPVLTGHAASLTPY